MIDWHQRLNHLRFLKLLLWADKFISLAFIAFFLLFSSPLSAAVVTAVLFVQYSAAVSYYHNIENMAGIPSSSYAICVA